MFFTYMLMNMASRIKKWCILEGTSSFSTFRSSSSRKHTSATIYFPLNLHWIILHYNLRKFNLNCKIRLQQEQEIYTFTVFCMCDFCAGTQFFVIGFNFEICVTLAVVAWYLRFIWAILDLWSWAAHLLELSPNFASPSAFCDFIATSFFLVN
jgi:hypothetical protein